jgi:hypothetical protein
MYLFLFSALEFHPPNLKGIAMKAFRVRDIGHVESNIGWKLMDGTAFVPVGGPNRSYLVVASSLLPEGAREGVISECDFDEGTRRSELQLVPVGKGHGGRGDAIVVFPSGGFELRDRSQRGKAISALVEHTAATLVLSPGDEIAFFPRVRTLREADAAKPVFLRYDGNVVTFSE